MSAVEVIEGEAVEVPTNALAVRGEDKSAALWEIGSLTDEEFERRKSMLKSAIARVADLQLTLLDKDEDWGAVPGVKRPFLWKSGAEKLAAFYKLVPEFHADLQVTPVDEMPDRLTYTTRCLLHYGSQDGPVVGEGVGVCSSHERRYLYRRGERTCPDCGKATVRKGKDEFGGGWYCDREKGCGHSWKVSGNRSTDASRRVAAQIDAQASGEALNTDPWDGANTYAKMSEKRAHVDAVIRTLGISSLFTQDEDAPSAPRSSGSATDPYGAGEDWGGMELGDSAPAAAAPSRAAPRTARGRQERQKAETEVVEAIARDDDRPLATTPRGNTSSGATSTSPAVTPIGTSDPVEAPRMPQEPTGGGTTPPTRRKGERGTNGRADGTLAVDAEKLFDGNGVWKGWKLLVNDPEGMFDDVLQTLVLLPTDTSEAVEFDGAPAGAQIGVTGKWTLWRGEDVLVADGLVV